MNKYVKWVNSDPKESVLRHAKFIASLKAFIIERNRNPDARRLHCKDALKNAQTVVQATVVGKRLKQKREAVELEVYKRDFPNETITDDMIKTEMIKGELKQVVYRNKGKEGYWDVEDYEDTSTSNTTTVADSAKGDDCKKVMDTLTTERNKALNTRYEKAVPASSNTDKILSMLQNLKSPIFGGAPSADAQTDDAVDGEAADDDEEGSGSNDESSDEEDEALRFARGQFASKQSKSASSKPKSTSTAGSTRPSVPQTAGTASKSERIETTIRPIAQLDGRTQALQSRIETQLQIEKEKLKNESSKVQGTIWHDAAFLTDVQEKQMVEDLKSIGKNATAAVSELKKLEGRVESSSQCDLLKGTKENVINHRKLAQGLEALCKHMQLKVCPAEIVIEIVDNAQASGIQMCPFFMGKYLRAHINTQAQYEHYSEIIAMLKEDSDVWNACTHHGIDPDGVSGFGWICIEELVLKLLRAICNREVRQVHLKCASKMKVSTFCQAIILGSESIPMCLTEPRCSNLRDADAIIRAHTVPLKMLQAAVENVDNSAEKGAVGDVDEEGGAKKGDDDNDDLEDDWGLDDGDSEKAPILTFFHKGKGHASGMLLRQTAVEQIEARREEGTAQAELAALTEMLNDSETNPRALDLRAWYEFFVAFNAFKEKKNLFKAVKMQATELSDQAEARFNAYFTRKADEKMADALVITGKLLQGKGVIDGLKLTDEIIRIDVAAPLDFKSCAPEQLDAISWMPASTQKVAEKAFLAMKSVSDACESSLRTFFHGWFLISLVLRSESFAISETV